MFENRPATRGQLRSVAILLGRFGLPARDRALGYCAAVVGRPVESRKDLTRLEASNVLDALETHLDRSNNHP